jgi:hypothetical protein
MVEVQNALVDAEIGAGQDEAGVQRTGLRQCPDLVGITRQHKAAVHVEVGRPSSHAAIQENGRIDVISPAPDQEVRPAGTS